MEYKNLFTIECDTKTVGALAFLLALPNVLGMLNIATPFGFKLHTFQCAIFVSALLYGPLGGGLSGLFGSVYSAVVMHNPYIAVGNALLGFSVGLFVRYGFHTLWAVLFGFAIQLPWLILTDYYLMHMSGNVILMLVIALTASNLLWAVAAHYSVRYLRPLIA